MSTHDKTRDAERKLERESSNHTSVDKEYFSDMEGLKENVAGLAQGIKDITADKAHDAAGYVQGRINGLKASGIHTVEKIEKRIKSKPGQSVAIAFVAGLLVSFLFGRRSS